ncbi:arginase [Botrytis cinerea]
MLTNILTVAALCASALAHAEHEHQVPIAGPHKSLWYNTLPGDGGTQADSVFSGISTFGRLPYSPCLATDDVKYDIAFIGAPFDTGTSYRPGARFGPSGIRQGSRRLNLYGGYNVPLATNPFDSWATVIDCGDIPVTSPSKVASINHGTYFYHAAQEGLLANDTNIHAGIRTTLSGPSDYENDGYCGFEIVEAREIDTIGMDGIIKKIRERVGLENPVYLSIDIDTLDPAFAPATGTPETGGWSTRELRTILRGLEGINLIAADIVEVAPAYDTNAEHTTMAAADALYEVLSLMVKKGPLSMMMENVIEDKVEI